MQERDELFKRFTKGYEMYAYELNLIVTDLTENKQLLPKETMENWLGGGRLLTIPYSLPIRDDCGKLTDYKLVRWRGFNKEEPAYNYWCDLAAKGGAWVLSNGIVRATPAPGPMSLWFIFVHGTLSGDTAEQVDNAWRYCPFAASVQALSVYKENEAHRDDEESEPKTNAVHLTDFRSVKWFGKKYTFSVNQARVIRLLWENWKNGTAEVGQETLLNEIDHASPPDRLNNVFRDQPAWGEMIVSGTTKGTFRLIELSSDLDLD